MRSARRSRTPWSCRHEERRQRRGQKRFIGVTAWFDPGRALLGLACVPMAFFTFAALFTLGAAASLRIRRGGTISDFLVFTTFTLSSLPSAAAFQGKARLLLYLCPALFTAYLPYDSLASARGWTLPLGTGASVVFLWLSSRLFTRALKQAEFSSVARLRR